MKWTCELGCDEPIEGDIDAVDDHLRLVHPDVYGDGPDRWPDGAIVVHDTTLTPEEFQ